MAGDGSGPTVGVTSTRSSRLKEGRSHTALGLGWTGVNSYGLAVTDTPPNKLATTPAMPVTRRSRGP